MSGDMPHPVSKYRCPCGRQPKFGYPGMRPTCCSVCKEDDMVDVYKIRKRPLCSCGEKPHYGLKGGKATHCEDCKEDDMGLIKPGFCFCGKQANFGFPLGKPISCKKCKEPEMINLKYMKVKGMSSSESEFSDVSSTSSSPFTPIRNLRVSSGSGVSDSDSQTDIPSFRPSSRTITKRAATIEVTSA